MAPELRCQTDKRTCRCGSLASPTGNLNVSLYTRSEEPDRALVLRAWRLRVSSGGQHDEKSEGRSATFQHSITAYHSTGMPVVAAGSSERTSRSSKRVLHAPPLVAVGECAGHSTRPGVCGVGGGMCVQMFNRVSANAWPPVW